MMRPLWTTSRLSVSCSGEGRLKDQSDAAWSLVASTPAGSACFATMSPSGHAMVFGSPASGGVVSFGSVSMTSSVWFGARMTQPMPSRNTARITGVGPPGLPMATAFFSLSMT
jgi:hypothetical protein